jgi:hypothetical protein
VKTGKYEKEMTGRGQWGKEIKVDQVEIINPKF